MYLWFTPFQCSETQKISSSIHTFLALIIAFVTATLSMTWLLLAWAFCCKLPGFCMSYNVLCYAGCKDEKNGWDQQVLWRRNFLADNPLFILLSEETFHSRFCRFRDQVSVIVLITSEELESYLMEYSRFFLHQRVINESAIRSQIRQDSKNLTPNSRQKWALDVEIRRLALEATQAKANLASWNPSWVRHSVDTFCKSFTVLELPIFKKISFTGRAAPHEKKIVSVIRPIQPSFEFRRSAALGHHSHSPDYNRHHSSIFRPSFIVFELITQNRFSSYNGVHQE